MRVCPDFVSTVVAVIGIGYCSTAAKADFDVRPYNVGGQIVTGGFDDGTRSSSRREPYLAIALEVTPRIPFSRKTRASMPRPEAD